ncbi:het-domain-containing protein [Fusarium flagelliforme]|uniref:Het-domain-containing protein n=2 Tax=Fusarium flagelliforme TaxID=2675880 RepID=A0A395MRQ7_9HYPO|nr:het-domain-containing protein [Fusarium flagelliforme]
MREEHLAAWLRLKIADPGSGCHLAPPIPPESCYRFQWGDFATLSYTWGDPRDTETIIINNVEMRVSINLAAALRSFRELNFFNGQFKLWADAVCINQADLDERSSQVAMMRDLYTSSWTTMAFLGAAADQSDKALALLKTLAVCEVNKTTSQLRDILQDNPAYLGGHGEWLALQAFLQRGYWSRLWVVQEAALAPSSMPMFVGVEYVTWKQVQDALTAIHTCLWYVKDLCLQYDRKMLCATRGKTVGEVSGLWDTENLHHIDKGLARLSRKRKRGESISYGDLLEVACATTCAEPLDKIYGLLAFIDPVIADQIVVDYKLPPSQVFSQVSQLFIIHDNSLELLRDGNPWNRTKTPSWAPDWTWKYHNRDKLSPTLPYHADGGLAAETSFYANGQVLLVRGVIIDRVKEMGCQSTIEQAKDKSVRTLEKTDVFCSAYGTLEPTRTALYHTLIGCRFGCMGEHQVLEDEGMPIFSLPTSTELAMKNFRERGWTEFSIQGQRYEHWRDWRRTNDEIELGDLGCVGDFFEDQIPDYIDKDCLWADFVRFRNVSSGRRFVTTSGGRFGWVPGGTEHGGHMEVYRGDLFCIVFGCSVPLVVRRVGNDYCVLGEGYLQGFMDGQILKELENRKVAIEELRFL